MSEMSPVPAVSHKRSCSSSWDLKVKCIHQLQSQPGRRAVQSVTSQLTQQKGHGTSHKE